MVLIIIILLGIIIYFILNTNLSKPASEPIKKNPPKPKPKSNPNIHVELHSDLVKAKDSEEFLVNFISLEMKKTIKEVEAKFGESGGMFLGYALLDLQNKFLENVHGIAKESNMSVDKTRRIIISSFKAVLEQ